MKIDYWYAACDNFYSEQKRRFFALNMPKADIPSKGTMFFCYDLQDALKAQKSTKKKSIILYDYGTGDFVVVVPSMKFPKCPV